jgi:hypothetical protein
LPPAQLACVKRSGEEQIANLIKAGTGDRTEPRRVTPAVSKRDFEVRSDHPSFITWWLHVRWSALAAFC